MPGWDEEFSVTVNAGRGSYGRSLGATGRWEDGTIRIVRVVDADGRPTALQYGERADVDRALAEEFYRRIRGRP